jgi:hypothetical protein
MLPRGFVLLFAALFFYIAVGVILSALIGLALGIRSAFEVMTFQGNPVPGLVFWVATLVFVFLVAVACRRMKLRVVRLAT